MKIAGLEPSVVVEPRDTAELSAVVAELYAADRPFAFVGGGTDLDLGNAPRALHTVVRTTKCAHVVDYSPEDQTITVQAGMTLGDVADVLAKNRQFLAIDAAEPEHMTIGGAIATNAYGRRRLRYGGIKDTIVGIEIVRPDGTRARGGGKVVKNVAGFDMPKLMVGSLGTLGAIVSATFRVYPIEQRAATVLYRNLDLPQVMQACDAIVGDALVPASVVAYDNCGAYDLVATFEGFARGVVEQVAAARSIASVLGVESEECPPDRSASFDRRERDIRRTGTWRITISAAPSKLAAFLASGIARGKRCVLYPLLGTALVAADDLDAAAIRTWRERLGGGSIVVTAMPAGARTGLDAWGSLPSSSLALMQRLKSNFDPKGLCNSGRYVGGI
ncbi:MAG: FAD-binding oxidoreductase [Candidatus Velthaea sp.]